jgi:hypothetical protein
MNVSGLSFEAFQKSLPRIFFHLCIRIFTEALPKLYRSFTEELPRFFFNLRNYRSFFERVYLLSSLIFLVTAAFEKNLARFLLF